MEERVHVLSDHVANQIAAGEVVERPASVVKELVENALDAGATRIRVEVEDGGKRLIRVIDNGCGMTPSDAMRALLRHATSKVRSADDLKRIGSLGFRGEALPSIRSVSRFRLRTRPHDAIEGVYVIADGADEPTAEPASGAPGTEIVIRDLFFNVPARRKFLRRAGTEMSRIRTLIEQFALGWPGVHMALYHNNRRIVETPADNDLRARILAVLGRDVCRQLYPVRLEMGQHSVEGFIGDATLHRGSARGMFTYVNGRFVRDRVIQHAITAAFGEAMERGRYPVAVLYLSVPPESVDVNVHPTKAEVRFVESGAVHAMVERAIRLSLADARIPENARPVMGGDRGLSPGTGDSDALPLFVRPGSDEPPAQEHPGTAESDRLGAASGLTGTGDFIPSVSRMPSGSGSNWPPLMTESVPQGDRSQEGLAALEFLSMLRGRYGVLRAESSLCVLDLQAAYQRIYEQSFTTSFSKGSFTVRRLLFPLQVELEPAQASVAQKHEQALAEYGFPCEPFGGRTWVIAAIPQVLHDAGQIDVIATFMELLGVLSAGADEVSVLVLCVLARAASQAAVVRPHAADEIRYVLSQLDALPAERRPKGPPVLLWIGLDDLIRGLADA